MLLRRRKYESRRGFTLVELVVVLVILAILASVAVPAFSRQLETGRERKAVTEAQACVTAATGLGAQKYTEARTAYIQDSSKKIDTTLAAWAGEVRDERPTVTGTLAQREGTGEYLLTPHARRYCRRCSRSQGSRRCGRHGAELLVQHQRTDRVPFI